ncbi:MAG: hypothetical protein J5903_00160, partial [Clostridia bacterium]|nr:hypothetical protein [Clostridia bacterium]
MENTMRIPMPKTQETARPDEDALDAVSEAFLSTSAVFGKSNREFEREFKEYKAAELFRRIECDLTGVLGDAELELKCAEATEKGLGGVTVLPQYVNKAKKVLRGKRTAVVATLKNV